MRKYALVDMGSNTIRLNVYEVFDNNEFELVFSQKELAGLANYIENGKMNDDGIKKACQILLKFRHILEVANIEEFSVFATASLRNIKNSEAAIKKIKKITGIDVDLVSGEDEAKFGYQGVMDWHHFETGMIFDLGGGSTEITTIKGGKVISATSLPIGSLNLFKKNVKELWPTQSEQVKIYSQVQSEFANCSLTKTKHLYGIGGTARAVLRIANHYFEKPSDNRVLTFSELNEIYSFVIQKDKIARDAILKACPDRIHTIIPGLVIMYNLCLKAQCSDIMIAPLGVREGYLKAKLSSN